MTSICSNRYSYVCETAGSTVNYVMNVLGPSTITGASLHGGHYFFQAPGNSLHDVSIDGATLFFTSATGSPSVLSGRISMSGSSLNFTNTASLRAPGYILDTSNTSVAQSRLIAATGITLSGVGGQSTTDFSVDARVDVRGPISIGAGASLLLLQVG